MTNKSKLILIDVDGVTGDLVNYVLDHLREEYPEDPIPTADDIREFHIDNFVTKEQWATAVELLDAPDTANRLAVYPGAVRAVTQLRDAGHRVQWLTSHWKTSRTWVWDRTEWLKRHFNAHPYDILYGHNKWYVRGDVLIDDKIENIDLWSKAFPAGRGRLFDRPWNQSSDLPRLYSWKTAHITELLAELER